MRYQKLVPLETRFWEKVSLGSPDECWPWLAGTTQKGYGRFKVVAGDLDQLKTENHHAHRVAFRLVHGRWPVPHALHGCDNTVCCNAVNPAHIHEGTQAQNLQEMTERGRRASGSALATWARRSLTAEDAREIRRRYAAGGITQAELATCFGISLSLVNRLVHGYLHYTERA